MVILVLLIPLYANGTRMSADDPIIPKTLDQHLVQIFGDKAKIAKAVFIHESEGLKLDAINYNCRYNGRSTFCKKGDEHRAWSVDCGMAQINTKGQICPEELFTLEGNMLAVEKIYKTQGLNAWVSYKNKSYTRFLKNVKIEV